jgi:hypothetical protein
MIDNELILYNQVQVRCSEFDDVFEYYIEDVIDSIFSSDSTKNILTIQLVREVFEEALRYQSRYSYFEWDDCDLTLNHLICNTACPKFKLLEKAKYCIETPGTIEEARAQFAQNDDCQSFCANSYDPETCPEREVLLKEFNDMCENTVYNDEYMLRYLKAKKYCFVHDGKLYNRSQQTMFNLIQKGA